MQTLASNKKPLAKTPKQTIENIRDFGSGFNGPGFADHLASREDSFFDEKPFKKQTPSQRKEFTVFNYQEYYERETVRRQIKELSELIKQEITLIKRADKSLLNEVQDIEKITVDALPSKPGIYHVRFLEIVLSILKTLRLKINESKTWLQALVSKKKKRGSLFLSLSKKKGTQYSLSQELQTARSVQ